MNGNIIMNMENGFQVTRGQGELDSHLGFEGNTPNYFTTEGVMKNILYFVIFLGLFSCSQDRSAMQNVHLEENSVLRPGMKIEADLPYGKICIEYVGKNKRRVTSELFDKIVPLDFPGDENWKINGKIVSAQYYEGVDKYTSEDIKYLEKYGASKEMYEFWKGVRSFSKSYYTSNGISVSYRYEQMPAKKMVFRATVVVSQFLVDGKLPSNLPGHSDDLIKVTYDNPYP